MEVHAPKLGAALALPRPPVERQGQSARLVEEVEQEGAWRRAPRALAGRKKRLGRLGAGERRRALAPGSQGRQAAGEPDQSPPLGTQAQSRPDLCRAQAADKMPVAQERANDLAHPRPLTRLPVAAT